MNATTTPNTPIIRARNVRKVFHGQEVLKGIDLQVRQGETAGFLDGPDADRPITAAA